MTVLPLLASAALLLVAAMHDAAFRTVPNTVSVLLALCGIALRLAAGDLPAGLAAALIVFAAATLCWRCGCIGGADVKLLGAAALLVPPLQVPAMIMAVALAGGALTLPYLIARNRLRRPAAGRPRLLLARVARAEQRRLRQGGPLPYAVAIAAGVSFAVMQGGIG
jgi:prepilin peptidase CpaA